MKTPRNVSSQDLAKALKTFGYERIRQDGSHIRMTTQLGGEHHLTIPKLSDTQDWNVEEYFSALGRASSDQHRGRDGEARFVTFDHTNLAYLENLLVWF